MHARQYSIGQLFGPSKEAPPACSCRDMVPKLLRTGDVEQIVQMVGQQNHQFRKRCRRLGGLSGRRRQELAEEGDKCGFNDRGFRRLDRLDGQNGKE